MISRICSCGELLFGAATGLWMCPVCGEVVPEKTCNLKGAFLCLPEECDRARECKGKKYGRVVE
jgi:uncharacterized Zn finger protein (UPF0148 family)